jgi:hypothetical protein
LSYRLAPLRFTHGAAPAWARFSGTVLESAGSPANNPVTLSKTELHSLVESYGGHYLFTADHLLLIFDDHHWARRCETQLVKLELSTQRWGCHIQLHGSW